jgi:hypothetical protein
MEKMYQDYKDVVEFRMIYIREAHSADGDRPTSYAKAKNINQQTTFEQRCTTAQLLMDEKKLTIPCLVDSMDNKTNLAYQAQPDRVFLVKTDGTLAVAADRGPRGFKPGVDKVQDWLKGYREKLESATKSQPSK